MTCDKLERQSTAFAQILTLMEYDCVLTRLNFESRSALRLPRISCRIELRKEEAEPNTLVARVLRSFCHTLGTVLTLRRGAYRQTRLVAIAAHL